MADAWNGAWGASFGGSFGYVPARRGGGFYGWSGSYATKRKRKRRDEDEEEAKLVQALNSLPAATPALPAVAEIREIVEPYQSRGVIDYEQLAKAKEDLRQIEVLFAELKQQLADERDDEDAVLFLM